MYHKNCKLICLFFNMKDFWFLIYVLILNKVVILLKSIIVSWRF